VEILFEDDPAFIQGLKLKPDILLNKDAKVSVEIQTN
jgi:hypothetical protein